VQLAQLVQQAQRVRIQQLQDQPDQRVLILLWRDPLDRLAQRAQLVMLAQQAQLLLAQQEVLDQLAVLVQQAQQVLIQLLPDLLAQPARLVKTVILRLIINTQLIQHKQQAHHLRVIFIGIMQLSYLRQQLFLVI
jgi:hypothetical protein